MLRLFAVLIFIFSLHAHSTLQGVSIVILKDKTQPSPADLQNIVNGTLLRWGDGSDINLYIEELTKIGASSFQEKFSLAKDKFINDWRIKFFSGKASLPKQVKNIEESLENIFEGSHSILIIFSSYNVPQDVLLKKGLKQIYY